MKLFRIIKSIIYHPLNIRNKPKALFRFICWQINSRIQPLPILYPFTERTYLIIQKGMASSTGNYYCGLYDFREMMFLLHFIRPLDLFIDAGANIGSYTVLASGQIGANSIAVEAVPSTFKHLLRNIYVNLISEKVIAFNVALGSHTGKVIITSHLDAMNHVVNKETDSSIEVSMKTLDELIPTQKDAILLKIDVEGFETEVINGAKLLLKQQNLKAIIIELKGLGSRYGFVESDLHNRLLDYGFNPIKYHPETRKFDLLETFGGDNTIYIRDIEFISNRLKHAAKIKIFNYEF